MSCIRIRRARAWRLVELAVLLPFLAFVSCDPSSDPNTPGPGPDPGPTLTRAPYLQSLGQTSVLIAFRTQDAVTASVDYGTTLAYGSTQTGSSGTRHAIQIEALTPGVRYYYRVRSGQETLVGGSDYFFDTDEGRSDGEFSFFVTGDVGDPNGAQKLTGERILATSPRSEIGLLCGDIIYPNGESSDYDSNLMEPWAPLMRSIALWPALGNHDWHVDPDLHFREEWYLPHNEHYYSFDRGNAHFIALDTRRGDLYDRANQIPWLRSDLEANRDADWVFAYYHHPGYTCTYKGFEQAVIESFHPLFDEFGVDVVFMGHAHAYERLYPIQNGIPLHQDQDPNYVDPQGTVYIVSGCGAKVKCEPTDDCALNATFIDCKIMFTHVTVEANKLTIRTIESANGTERDRVTITKTGL